VNSVNMLLLKYYYYYFTAKAYPIPRGRKKWFENVNAGIVCRLKTVVEQDSVESLNDNR